MERTPVYCQNCRSRNSLRDTHCQNCGTRLLLVVFPQSLQFDTNHVPSYYEDHLLERVSLLELRLVQMSESLRIAMEIIREQGKIVREAIEAHELYRDWIVEIRSYLIAKGVAATTIDAEERRIRDLLKLDGMVAFDPEAGWASYTANIGAFAAACAAGRAKDALALLDIARATWRDTHDRKCDWVYGMIDLAARTLGEGCIGDLWDTLMAPM